VANDTKDLLERALDDNDQAAWDELIEQSYNVVKGVLAARGLFDIDHKDLAHFLFLRIRPHLDSLEIRSRPAFLSYVKRTAQNLSIDEFRRRGRWVFVSSSASSEEDEGVAIIDSLPDEHPASNPEETTSDRELRERLRECRDGLSGENKKIVDLYYEEDKTYQEIGHMMGLTVSAAWKRLAQVLKQLRECVEKHENQNKRKKAAG
jgi:RNA polymerase sigma-70 factor, ECF subfamily